MSSRVDYAHRYQGHRNSATGMSHKYGSAAQSFCIRKIFFFSRTISQSILVRTCYGGGGGIKIRILFQHDLSNISIGIY